MQLKGRNLTKRAIETAGCQSSWCVKKAQKLNERFYS